MKTILTKFFKITVLRKSNRRTKWSKLNLTEVLEIFNDGKNSLFLNNGRF